jgi:hypothetical protein
VLLMVTTELCSGRRIGAELQPSIGWERLGNDGGKDSDGNATDAGVVGSQSTQRTHSDSLLLTTRVSNFTRRGQAGHTSRSRCSALWTQQTGATAGKLRHKAKASLAECLLLGMHDQAMVSNEPQSVATAAFFAC